MCLLFIFLEINLIIDQLSVNHRFSRLFLGSDWQLQVGSARIIGDGCLDWDLNIVLSKLW